eukprot:jgi/Mesvir1/11633/Mv00035-RA.3
MVYSVKCAAPCCAVYIGTVVLLLWTVLSTVDSAPMGINLPAVTTFPYRVFGGEWLPASTSGIFVDLFKHSTVFEPQSRGTTSTGAWNYLSKVSIEWASDGYPNLLNTSSKPSYSDYSARADIGKPNAFYASGTYLCLYDGQGRLSFEGDATVQETAPGRIVLNIQRASGFSVRIVDTLPTDYLRNIRIIPQAAEASYLSDPFQPEFLSALQGFSVLRFGRWQITSISQGAAANAARNWTRRVTPTSQTQASQDPQTGGVAIEHIVQLAAALHASPWLCLPMVVDGGDQLGNLGAYHTGLALYLRDNLPLDLPIYLEYADGGPGTLSTHQRDMTLRIYAVWSAVFALESGVGAGVARLRLVASALRVEYVPHILSNFGDTGLQKLSAVAVTGLFGSGDTHGSTLPCHYCIDDDGFGGRNPNVTVDDVIALARSGVLQAEATYVRIYHQLAVAGLAMLAYAGGPDLRAYRYGARDNLDAANSCVGQTNPPNATHPCTIRFPPGIRGIGEAPISFQNLTSLQAAMPTLQAMAEEEARVARVADEARRDPRMKQLMMDFLRRWDAISASIKVPEGFPACVWGTCVPGQGGAGTCRCFAGYSGASCSVGGGVRPNSCSGGVGMNIGGLSDWSTQWTFVDIFRTSREWIAQEVRPYGPWSIDAPLDIGEEGYPRSLALNVQAGSMMIRDLQAHFPGGWFNVFYDGDGVLDCSMTDVKEVRRMRPGHLRVLAYPSTTFNNGIFLTIVRSNPGDPIRNIRVVMPGFEDVYDEQPFHPWLVQSLQQYSVLRFMDWMATNARDQPSRWAQRPTFNGTRTFAGDIGAPVEAMVLLSNMIGAAPWFTFPHKADEEYLRSFATLVRDTLRPDVDVYLEYSNEVWHTGFPGGQYAQEEGLRLNLGPQGAASPAGAANEARLCYLSERTKQIAEIWRDVFGADTRSRLHVVLAAQTVWTLTSEIALSCRDAYKYVDHLGLGPYFGGSWLTEGVASQVRNLTYLMEDYLPDSIDGYPAYRLNEHAQIAARYNVSLVAYEAGQHMVGDGSSTDMAILANRDPRMRGLYMRYYSMLRSLNFTLSVAYSSCGLPSKYGSWGLIETMDQERSEAPKYLGLMDYIAEHGLCTGSATKTAAVAASSYGGCPGNGDCSGGLGECLYTGSCGCYFGRSGDGCEIGEYVDNYDCGYYCTFGQGDCQVATVVKAQRYWNCSCHDKFYGEHCSLFDCKDKCNQAGTCLDPDICSCYPGYTGEFCETDCRCNGHGQCNADASKCVCDEGWRWSDVPGQGCVWDCDCPGNLNTTACIGPGECGCDLACVWGTCIHGQCRCYAGVTGASCDVLPPVNLTASPVVGMNVGASPYWTTQWVWVDVMKQSSEWWSGKAPDWHNDSMTDAWDNGTPQSLRAEDGYPSKLLPGQVLRKLTVRNVVYHGVPGRYTCLFDGKGILSFGMDARVVNVAKGRVEFDFNPSANVACHESLSSPYCSDNGIHLEIRETDPGDPVRNIRLIMPGFEDVAERLPFHPLFLKSLDGYRVLRFSDWMQVNQALSPEQADKPLDWSQRRKTTWHTQADGVALEYIILLCNTLGAAPWISVPHAATDDYVGQLASSLRLGLRPDLDVYVEYSNEVWAGQSDSGAYPQGGYARRKGLALGLSSDATTAQYRYYSQRSLEIFRMFKAAFQRSDSEEASGVGGSNRVLRVMATWTYICSGAGWETCGALTTREVLSWQDAWKQVDMVAITG